MSSQKTKPTSHQHTGVPTFRAASVGLRRESSPCQKSHSDISNAESRVPMIPMSQNIVSHKRLKMSFLLVFSMCICRSTATAFTQQDCQNAVQSLIGDMTDIKPCMISELAREIRRVFTENRLNKTNLERLRPTGVRDWTDEWVAILHVLYAVESSLNLKRLLPLDHMGYLDKFINAFSSVSTPSERSPTEAKIRSDAATASPAAPLPREELRHVTVNYKEGNNRNSTIQVSVEPKWTVGDLKQKLFAHFKQDLDPLKVDLNLQLHALSSRQIISGGSHIRDEELLSALPRIGRLGSLTLYLEVSEKEYF